MHHSGKSLRLRITRARVPGVLNGPPHASQGCKCFLRQQKSEMMSGAIASREAIKVWYKVLA